MSEVVYKDINTATPYDNITGTDYVLISKNGVYLGKVTYADLAQNLLNTIKLTINGHQYSVKEALDVYSIGLEYGELAPPTQANNEEP